MATAAESAGATFFTSRWSTPACCTCTLCHALPLGTDGFSSFEGEPQEFKIAHLRNAYQKVGMFGSAGNQVRGFGFLHDGSVATVFNFLQASVFTFGSGANTKRRNLEAFIMAFDTGLKPAVGQQVSVTPSSVGDATVIARIDLLVGRDDAGDCELVVKGVVGGEARGWVYAGGNNFRSDRASEPLIDKTALRTLAGDRRPGAGLYLRAAGLRPAHRRRPRRRRPLRSRRARHRLRPDRSVQPAGGDGTRARRRPRPQPRPPCRRRRPGRGRARPTGTPTGTATATITATRTQTPPVTATSTPTITPSPTAGSQLTCAGGVALAQVKVKIARNDLPAGDEKLIVKGQLQLPSLLPAIDPIANGFSLQLRDRGTAQPLLTRVVPPGASTPGWSSGSPTWKFLDHDGVLAGGVTKIVLKDRSSRTPGLFEFRLRGKDADFRVATDNLELVVILGGPTQGAGGQCGSVSFNPGGTPRAGV